MRYVLALLAFLVPTALAAALEGGAIVIIDGDTIALPPLAQTHGGKTHSEHIRLLAIDAPETHHPRCDAELRAGLAAKARLTELLRGQEVDIRRKGHDRYRRTLASVWVREIGASVPWRDVGAVLLAEGLALPWRPGPVAKAGRLDHWCGARDGSP